MRMWIDTDPTARLPSIATPPRRPLREAGRWLADHTFQAAWWTLAAVMAPLAITALLYHQNLLALLFISLAAVGVLGQHVARLDRELRRHTTTGCCRHPHR